MMIKKIKMQISARFETMMKERDKNQDSKNKPQTNTKKKPNQKQNSELLMILLYMKHCLFTFFFASSFMHHNSRSRRILLFPFFWFCSNLIYDSLLKCQMVERLGWNMHTRSLVQRKELLAILIAKDAVCTLQSELVSM